MIVCGTILIAVPYIHNTLGMQEVAEAMVALGKPVNLTAHMPKYTDTVCMIGGVLMILVGAISGLRSDEREA